MQIVKALPPNIDEIDAAFGVRKILEKQGIWFSYGTRLFNPNDVAVPPAILVHETVHGERQLRLDPDPEKAVRRWWTAYIEDPAFRLDEEIAAHRAEFQWHAGRPDSAKPIPGFRSRREWHLQQIALRLSGPLYGRMISLSEARRAITE